MRRMAVGGVEDLPDYLERLREDETEVRTLFRDLLITITGFFRDADAFEALEQQVIPRLFEGEGPGPELQVFASDIAEDALVRGREGFYPKAIADDLSPERLGRFFSQEGDGYRVRQELRETVLFAPHNLLTHPPFSRLDLISCRNLLIYLEREAQRKVLELFHYALRPGGYLFLSPSESPGGSDLFRAVVKKQGIFQRQNVSSEKLHLPRLPSMETTPSLPRLGGASEKPSEAVSYRTLHQRLLAQHAPPSVLVNGEHDIVHLSGNAGRYLGSPAGEPTDNILERVREELRMALRAALYKALEKGEPSATAPVVVRLEGERRRVGLRVQPTEAPNEGFALLLFEESEPTAKTPQAQAERTDGAELNRKLEEELEDTKKQMRAVVEGYETTQEEMRASYEELQSINEELRSTTEELETSREELQSMNEELMALNQENKNKVEELKQLSGDLENLISATDIATLFLDKRLCIRRFTPPARELFNIQTTDQGRPLTDFTHKLSYPGLLEDAQEVLGTLTPVERELSSKAGSWYLTKILPYRSVDDRIEGVVITLVDITVQKQAEQQLKTFNETLETRVAERTGEVRRLASALTLAEQRERSRIAQVMHDDVQQILHALQMRAKLFAKKMEGGAFEHEEPLSEMLELVAQALRTTRTLSVQLSPAILRKANLEASLRWLGSHMREVHGLEVALDLPDHDGERLPEDKRVLLFQIVQELLFNVVKHAKVTRARLAARHHEGGVTVRVEDDGVGFVADEAAREPGQSFGLASVRERLRLFGGSLELDTQPGAGTRITLTLPLGADEGRLDPLEREAGGGNRV